MILPDMINISDGCLEVNDMNILVCMDAFKHAVPAWDACQSVEEGLLAEIPGLNVVTRPMADGGEGTARELMALLQGRWVAEEVSGPFPEKKVEAGYVWFEDRRTALVEMACANGIELLDASALDPLRTSTYGTGQLIKAAAARGADRILLAVGGSATIDGGIGAAMALGWRFLDEAGTAVGHGGGALERIRRIEAPRNLSLPPITVMCDVTNPLYGTIGAARVFGPQKGASPEDVEIIERGMVNLAKLATMFTGRVLHPFPGAGAAGGLAGGAAAFMNAELAAGSEIFAEWIGLEKLISQADWVITGEGIFDETSLNGKVVSGVAALAAPMGKPVVVLAGRVSVAPYRYRQFGIRDAIAITPASMPTSEALPQTSSLLSSAAVSIARKYFTPNQPPTAPNV